MKVISLATYGTLQPGQRNHHHVEMIEGTWVHGKVHGELLPNGWGAAYGFPALTLDPDGAVVPVQVLTSEDLASHLDRLDAFEGPGYQRVVTLVETAAGNVPAYIYVLADSDDDRYEVRFPLLYSVEREYSVDMDAMWDAWTRADALQAWYHPTMLSPLPDTAVSELEVDGIWAVSIDVPEHDFTAYFYGQYTSIIQGEQIIHTMHYTQSAEEFAARDFSTPSHDVVIDFESRGDRTWVRFAQYGELPEGEPDRAKAGMQNYFDSLGQYLAS